MDESSIARTKIEFIYKEVLGEVEQILTQLEEFKATVGGETQRLEAIAQKIADASMSGIERHKGLNTIVEKLAAAPRPQIDLEQLQGMMDKAVASAVKVSQARAPAPPQQAARPTAPPSDTSWPERWIKLTVIVSVSALVAAIVARFVPIH